MGVAKKIGSRRLGCSRVTYQTTLQGRHQSADLSERTIYQGDDDRFSREVTLCNNVVMDQENNLNFHVSYSSKASGASAADWMDL